MSRRGIVRVIEAGYRWLPDENEWLSGIVETASAFSVGGGTVGYTVEIDAGGSRVASAASPATRTRSR